MFINEIVQSSPVTKLGATGFKPTNENCFVAGNKDGKKKIRETNTVSLRH